MEAIDVIVTADIFRRCWPYIAGASVLILVPTVTYCVGRGDGKSGAVVKEQQRTIELQQDAAGAASTAADQRIKGTITIAEQKKDLDDAIKTGEDPAVLRARRGCLILRQQGRDTSGIAACARFEAGR